MPSTPKPKPKSPDNWRWGLAFGGEIVGTLTLWLFLGYLADKYLHLKPLGLLLGGLIGVGYILWRIIQLSMKK